MIGSITTPHNEHLWGLAMRYGRRTAAGVLGLVGLILAGATTFGPAEPSTEVRSPADSAPSTTDKGHAGWDTADGWPVIALGGLVLLAAAFPSAQIGDSCFMIGRDDLPVEVRPDEEAVRTLELHTDGGMGCRLEYRTGPGPVALVITISSAPTTSWPGILAPALVHGATAMTFAGRPGLKWTVTDPQGRMACLGLMLPGIRAGIVLAQVSNTRYPTVHSCEIAAAILTAIAHRTL